MENAQNLNCSKNTPVWNLKIRFILEMSEECIDAMQGEWRWRLIPNCSLCWGGLGSSSWCLCLCWFYVLWREIPGWSWAEVGHSCKQSQDLAFLSAWHRELNHHLCHIVLRRLAKLNLRCHAKTLSACSGKDSRLHMNHGDPTFSPRVAARCWHCLRARHRLPECHRRTEIRKGGQLWMSWPLNLGQCCSKWISGTSSSSVHFTIASPGDSCFHFLTPPSPPPPLPSLTISSHLHFSSPWLLPLPPFTISSS